MADQFNESTVEEATLSWFEELGYLRLDLADGPATFLAEGFRCVAETLDRGTNVRLAVSLPSSQQRL